MYRLLNIIDTVVLESVKIYKTHSVSRISSWQSIDTSTPNRISNSISQLLQTLGWENDVSTTSTGRVFPQFSFRRETPFCSREPVGAEWIFHARTFFFGYRLLEWFLLLPSICLRQGFALTNASPSDLNPLVGDILTIWVYILFLNQPYHWCDYTVYTLFSSYFKNNVVR